MNDTNNNQASQMNDVSYTLATQADDISEAADNYEAEVDGLVNSMNLNDEEIQHMEQTRTQGQSQTFNQTTASQQDLVSSEPTPDVSPNDEY